ncbi:MAG: NTE family protein [Planctomycetota bacterium]|jgi:NTE family protein
MKNIESSAEQLAVVMSGGGARSAYQVGCLAQLVRSFPSLGVPILTGVSAGAINAVTLAAYTGNLPERVDRLTQFWRELELESVFRCTYGDLFRRAIYWGSRLMGGGHKLPLPEMRGMVDTTPLWNHLRSCLAADGDRLPGIEENLNNGQLSALAVTGSSYSTGQTITWFQGREVSNWKRGNRISERAEIGVAEVMASAALPLLFPAVEIRGRWYGDGGIRLTAPLAPAIHLGATRILAVSTRHEPENEEAHDRCMIDGYPPPAQVMGSLLNAVFLDQLEGDALRLQRTNRLLAELPKTSTNGLRPIDLCVLRPSQDLGELANKFEARLPRAFRFMTRGLGTKETRSNDMLSMLMFQADYVEALIELGIKDTLARETELAAFLQISNINSQTRNV